MFNKGEGVTKCPKMCLREIWMVPSEYIRDKNHVRMNATKWVTLSGFCKYLGSSGQCKIDETEKGKI